MLECCLRYFKIETPHKGNWLRLNCLKLYEELYRRQLWQIRIAIQWRFNILQWLTSTKNCIKHHHHILFEADDVLFLRIADTCWERGNSRLTSLFGRSRFYNTDYSLLTGGTAVELGGKKKKMNLQQPTTLIPPVHPDVQMKPLPFYDVLDVLIKPSSLGMLYCPSWAYTLLCIICFFAMLSKLTCIYIV